jgi:hypothetical protein
VLTTEIEGGYGNEGAGDELHGEGSDIFHLLEWHCSCRHWEIVFERTGRFIRGEMREWMGGRGAKRNLSGDPAEMRSLDLTHRNDESPRWLHLSRSILTVVRESDPAVASGFIRCNRDLGESMATELHTPSAFCDPGTWRRPRHGRTRDCFGSYALLTA